MKKRAFTLIELVMVITIVAILASMFSSFIAQATNSWFFIKSRSTASGNARFTLNRITAELRKIAGTSQISIMTNGECKFVDISGNSIDFKQSGTQILRNTDALADGIATNGLIFTYLDSAGNTTAVAANVRSIRIRVIVAKNTQTSVMETSVMLRNI